METQQPAFDSSARITPKEFERCLEKLLNLEGVEQNTGVFGPKSEVWKIGKYTSCILGGLRAGIMQLAYAEVASAILDHSRTKEEPYKRLVRTFFLVSKMCFDPLDQAIGGARQLYNIHSKITGEIKAETHPEWAGKRYSALDRESLAWVHLTLMDTQIQMHELLVGSLSQESKDRYCQESQRFGYLLGIDRHPMYRSYLDFCQYRDHVLLSSRVHIGHTARQLVDFLFALPHLPSSLQNKLKSLSIWLLPPVLQKSFNHPGQQPKLSLFLLKKMYIYGPNFLTLLPPYVYSMDRLANRKSNLITLQANRLYFGMKTPH